MSDAAYEEWLDAAAAGEAFYLACPNGHGSLPPRSVCPECGDDALAERPLPRSGAIETVTVTTVPTPSFADDAPYATAIATFDPMRLTGQVRGIDPDDVEPGLTVEVDVARSETTGDRLVVFRPR